MHDTFAGRIRDVFNPFAPTSGTEHVGPWLYSLLRMTRAETVVEFGSGFTTAYIAAALARNERDYVEHRRTVVKRAGEHRDAITRLAANTGATLSPPEAKELLMRHLAKMLFDGTPPLAPNPFFYQRSYSPHLFTFERHPETHRYVGTLKTLLTSLGLEKYVTIVCDATVAGYTARIPAARRPIQLAWNDHFDKREFVHHTYDELDPVGGMIILHSPSGFPAEVAAIRARLVDDLLAGTCEMLTLQEPNKFLQNGCLLIRRCQMSGKDPLQVVDEALAAFLELSTASVDDTAPSVPQV